MAETEAGDTYVGRGTLVLNSPSLADTAWVIIGDSGTLELNFAGTDIVAGFAVGESGFGPGIYNASNTSGQEQGGGIRVHHLGNRSRTSEGGRFAR